MAGAPGPAIAGRGATALVLAVAGALFAAVEAFAVWDYDAGPVRFGLVVALGLAATAVGAAPSRVRLEAPAGRAATAVAVALLAAGVAVDGSAFVAGLRDVAARGDVVSDQARTVLRSLTLLRRGIDPYGKRTLVDPVAYDFALDELERTPRCAGASLAFDSEAARARVLAGEATVEEMDRYQLVRSADPGCAGVKRRFESVGLKYGPVMMLGYWPFVAALGKGGVLVSNLVCWAALVGLVLWWAWRRTRVPLVAATAAAFALLSIHVRWNLLEKGHTDALPTLLAVAALAAWLHGRRVLAAVLVGLSIGAKTTPGILFLPLLLASPGAVLAGLGTVAVVFLPFLLWDPAGLVNNLAYAGARPPDSTSLAFHLEPWAAWALVAAAGALCLWLTLRVRRSGWSAAPALHLVLCAHLALYAVSGQFHNNYVVWLLPVLGMFLADAFERARA